MYVVMLVLQPRPLQGSIKMNASELFVRHTQKKRVSFGRFERGKKESIRQKWSLPCQQKQTYFSHPWAERVSMKVPITVGIYFQYERDPGNQRIPFTARFDCKQTVSPSFQTEW